MNEPHKVARDLHEIAALATALHDQAIHKANAALMPGGDAMVALAPVGNQEAWQHRYDTAERLALDTSFVELEDDADQPPLQMLRAWSDRYRAVLGAEYDHIPTIASETNFLRFHLDWIAMNEPLWDAFARTVNAARLKSENILYAGDRAERSRIICDQCDTPRRLIKLRAVEGADDAWKCTNCKTRYGIDDLARAHARMLRSEGAERWVTQTEAIATLKTQGRPERTIRKWLADGEGAGYCDPKTHVVWVWWPDLWRKHLITPTRKREAA